MPTEGLAVRGPCGKWSLREYVNCREKADIAACDELRGRSRPAACTIHASSGGRRLSCLHADGHDEAANPEKTAPARKVASIRKQDRKSTRLNSSHLVIS